jgi:hypothetical protein
MNLEGRPHVGMDVHVAWKNRLPGDVDHFRARRNRHFPLRADGHDAIVSNHDVALRNHLGAFHREDACAAQHHDSARLVLGNRDRDVATRRFIDRTRGRATATATPPARIAARVRRVAQCPRG